MTTGLRFEEPWALVADLGLGRRQADPQLGGLKELLVPEHIYEREGSASEGKAAC